MASESVKVDTKKRTLGEKFYTDEDWSFETDYRSSSFTTSSTSYVDITGSSLTIFFEKTTTVMVLFTVHQESATSTIGLVALYIDGDIQSPVITGTDQATVPVVATAHVVTSVDAGSHTFKLKLQASSPAQVEVTHRRLSVINLVES